VNEIASRVALSEGVVVVERVPGNPQLSENRRATVLNEMQQRGLDMPAESVVLLPVRDGLLGIEAARLYRGFLRSTGAHARGASGAGWAAGANDSVLDSGP
jgi:hypothetical protein